jgi:hypothetical protein
MESVLTYPDLHGSSIVCGLQKCTGRHHKFWKRFLTLLGFSTAAVVPLALLYPREAKLLIVGLLGQRVIELVGEALVTIGEEV